MKLQADRVRAEELQQQITNLTVQLGAISGVSIASEAVVTQIERLAAEKKRAELRIKSAPQARGQPLDDAGVTERIRETLENLQLALESDDREAHRARELLRALVDRIVLSPTPNTLSDGRGAGDVRVSVEGSLAALVNLADFDIDRVAKHGHRPMFILDNENSVWRFTFDIPWENPRLDQVRADLPVISKLLDHADVPVPMEAFVDALADHPLLQRSVDVHVQDGAEAYTVAVDEPVLSAPDRSARLRARNAVAYLSKRGFIRGINTRTKSSGYVWNDRGMSDEAWIARIHDRPMTQTLPVIRLSTPTAIPVVVGRRSPEDQGESDR